MEKTPGTSSSLCVRAKKPTNFGLWRMVCKPFVDNTAQVRSPVHTYAHLVRKPFASGLRTILRTCVYEALDPKAVPVTLM